MTRSILVITGAGASTGLGAGGKPIPMMKEWATSLVDRLGPERARQIGIEPDMAGDRFEAELGKFLSFAAGLDRVNDFGYFGSPGRAGLGKTGSFTEWWEQARRAVDQTMVDIHENLWDCFGWARVDADRAKNAYFVLHHDGLLWGLGDTRVWHATTNFDPALEIAIDQDGSFERVDGFTEPPGGGTRTYSPERLDSLAASEGNRDQVPVMHLHGAVGWYYDDDNNIIKDPPDRRFDSGRTPALLLPDDAKNPSNFLPGLDSTWTIFQSVLRRATHVLVLGHSLFDKHLVAALRSWVGNNIAFVKYQEPAPDGSYEPPAAEEVEQFSALVGRTATVIPGKFGQAADHPDFDLDLLQRWSRRA